MAKRRNNVVDTLTGSADEDLSPFAIPLGVTAQRATGRKTMKARKGDKPRDLNARVKRGVGLSVPRQSAVQRAYDAAARVAPGAAPALQAFEDITGLREGYDALIRGGRQALVGDVYAGNPDLQAEDALTLGLTGVLGGATAPLGAAARRASASRLGRYLTEARPVAETLAARPAVSRAIPRERVMSLTAEETPGAASQHRPDILGGDFAVRQQYSKASPWTQRTPEGEDYDVLYAAQGIPQRPTEEAVGAYLNSLGVLERNPVAVIQPEVGDLSADMLARIRATENLRGLGSAQEAMAGNMPTPDEAGNAMLFRMQGQPSAEQMSGSAEILDAAGAPLGMTPSSQGGVLFPFGEDRAQDFPAVLEELRRLYPQAEAIPARNTGFFDPAFGRWGDEGIEATKPFSGEATMQTLQSLADAPAETGMALSSSPAVREGFRGLIARDTGAQGVREDLQNTRRFFADADWRAALDLIRRGVSPAAALAALGYSTSALAADGR